jgi:uncharacterized protein YjbI with pentapeptide repeats
VTANRFETYPGLQSFCDDDVSRQLYAGREAEKNALLDLVTGEPIVVLFSRSGLGKTSLINAGLMQPLRDRGFFAVVARVTLLPDPVASVVLSMRSAAAAQKVTIHGGDESSLWHFLNSTQFTRDGQQLKLVLVLDQFEELFTRVRETVPEKEQQFIDDLANVVRRRVPDELAKQKAEELERLEEMLDRGDGRPEARERRDALVYELYETTCRDVKVLIVIREDYLADLERLREPIPTVFHKMMRLDPLTPEHARLAIEEPAAREGIPGKDVFHWEPAAIDEILAFLKKRTAERRTANDASIDPGQLQLICHSIDMRRTGNRITAAQLHGEKGMDRILNRFYRDTLAQIPPLRLGRNSRRFRPSTTNLILFNRPRAAVRLLCQRGLITRGGYRDSMMRDTICSRFGVSDRDLKVLESGKLVRSTMRQEREFFELSHDTLVRPLQAAATRRRYAALALFYLLLCLLPFAVHEFNDWRKEQRASAEVVAQNAHVAEVVAKIQKPGAKLRGADLAGLTLSFSTLERVDLTGADVSDTTWDGSRFIGCRLTVRGDAPIFRHAVMFDTQMNGAAIPKADFSEAELTNVDFRGAVLTGARFRGVSMDGIDFSGATIDGADFSGTPWWLARGWTAQQIDDLSARFPVSAYKASLRYKLDLENAERSDPAYVLNEVAWCRAIRGTDLDLALKDADESVKMQPEDAARLDTRAYIRLQLGDAGGALADARKAVTSVTETQGSVYGGYFYRLALAEKAAGDHESAAKHFSQSVREGYLPTYELVLTPSDDPLRHSRPQSIKAAAFR